MKKATYINIVLFILLVLFCGLQDSYAQTISARFTTAAYTWEQQENDSSSANHLRAYQLARLSIGNMGLKNLSLHTYMLFSGDFADNAVNDPKLWLYNFYLNLRNVGKPGNAADISLGRQRIYAGVGYGTVDGLQVNYKFRDYFKLKTYFGVLAPTRESDSIEDFKTENLSYGFQLTTRKINRMHIGLSFANLSRPQLKYTSPGIYTGSFRLDHPASPLQRQLLGLDVSGKLSSKIRLNGRLDFNLKAGNVKRGEFGGRYIINKNLEMGLDYIYRLPYIDYNSIFSVFAVSENQEMAFHANYRMKDYRFYLNASSIFFDGDDGQRFGMGFGWKLYYFGYNKRAGYGGSSDGLTANMTYPVRQHLHLTLSSNIASYKLAAEDDREGALMGAVGINYIPKKNITLQAETQLMNNERFSRDVRFFVRGSYMFFHRIAR